MTEDEAASLAEIAKQMRIRNLIELRRLANDSTMVAEAVGRAGLTQTILEELIP